MDRRRACPGEDCSLSGLVHAGDVFSVCSRSKRGIGSVWNGRERQVDCISTGRAPRPQWPVPDSACELPRGRPDAPHPWSSPWTFRGSAGRPDSTAQPDGHPGAVRAGIICGAGSFVAITLFGQLHDAWLRIFLELQDGISSHNTLGRVFARLDATGGEEGFRDWVQGVFEMTDRQVVLIEGPRTRGPRHPSHGNPQRIPHNLLRQDRSPGRASPTSGWRRPGIRTICAGWLASSPHPRRCSRPGRASQGTRTFCPFGYRQTVGWNYPLRPVREIPSMKLRWAKKKARKTGNVISDETAISHG